MKLRRNILEQQSHGIWEKGEDGQIEKNKKKDTFENLLLTLQNLLTEFLLHYFINKLQTSI